MAFLDFDDDGRLDLFVANDSGPNYLYRNRGDGTFQDVSYPSGAALNELGLEQAHMGVAVGDYDHDGRDDLHVTNFADDSNVLYHNDGGGMFTDVSFSAGVGHLSIPFLGWGTHFLDYDNDGWLDVFVANGHVYPIVDGFDWNTSYRQRALLFRNVKGKFVEIGGSGGEGLTTARCLRGSAAGDFDNDGDIDLLSNAIDDTPALLRNDGGQSRGALADPAPRRRYGPALSARRHRLRGVLHRQRVSATGRGGERPEPGVAVRSPGALRPRLGHPCRSAGGALGQRTHCVLRDSRRRHGARHRPDARSGELSARPGAPDELVAVKQPRERPHHLTVVVLRVTPSNPALAVSRTIALRRNMICARPAPPMRRYATSWTMSASGLVSAAIGMPPAWHPGSPGPAR